MSDLLFSANAVLPIIIMVFLGWTLKKIKLVNDNFLTVGNRLTFKVLLPILLFNNVYAIQSFSAINWTFVLYGVAGVVAIFLLATACNLNEILPKYRCFLRLQAFLILLATFCAFYTTYCFDRKISSE